MEWRKGTAAKYLVTLEGTKGKLEGDVEGKWKGNGRGRGMGRGEVEREEGRWGDDAYALLVSSFCFVAVLLPVSLRRFLFCS
jgi:hypothetical protein